jgi:hypothetical protein
MFLSLFKRGKNEDKAQNLIMYIYEFMYKSSNE